MNKRARVSKDPEILKRLRTLQPSTLYLITSKALFLLGFNDYIEERLQSFTWNEDMSVLCASLRDGVSYPVRLSLRGQSLQTECPCPEWGPEFQCKHVICTLVTLINLLSPKIYFQARHTPLRLRNLRSSLLGGKVAPSEEEGFVLDDDAMPDRKMGGLRDYRIVIESIDDYPAIYIQSKGRVISSPINLPQGLSVFTYRYFSDRSLQERLTAYLGQFGNQTPLVFVSDAGTFPIQWDPSLIYQTKTELHATGDAVEIQALCLHGNTLVEKVERFWNFVVNPETGTLGRATKTEGWRLYDKIDGCFKPSPSDFGGDSSESPWQMQQEQMVRNRHFRITKKTFRSFQLNFAQDKLKEIRDDLVFRVDGRIVSPMEGQQRYALTIVPSPGGTLILRAESRFGNMKGEPTAPTFSFFAAIGDTKLPAPLRALKRQAHLCNTFFELIAKCNKANAVKAIGLALSNDDFVQYSVKSAARDLLKRHFSAFAEQDLRLWLGEAGWCLAANDKEKEAALYHIPFNFFGVKIFKEMPKYSEMTVPAQELYAQLPHLYSALKAADIELCYGGSPVASVQWEFSFDATRSSGIDWFEIKPEIRADGVLVDEKVWRDLLQQQGRVEREGALQIVDAQTQSILKTLSLIYKRAGKSDRMKKEIVRVPNLQILDWIALRKEGVRVTLSPEDEALIGGLTQFDQIDRIAAPRHLQAKLRPYQQEGLDWLAFLYRHRFGACLADDMGLGKTLQALSLLAAIKEKILPAFAREEAGPHLIVVPPSLLFNWESEIARFYPRLKIAYYAGKDRTLDFKDADLVLTTYSIVRRDIDRLKEVSFHVIVFDEAQAVKNLYAAVTGAVRQLRGRFKLVVTGTPLENHIGEYYSLIDLCLPGLLGEYDRFKSQIKVPDSPMLDILMQRTRPFMLRRIKEAILKELPPKIETDIYLELTPRQKGLYQKTVAGIKPKIQEAYQNKSDAQAKIIALTAILKLRQLCISTHLVDADPEYRSQHSPKMKFLVNQLEELLQEGHSALVFSQFTSALDLLEEDLGPTRIPYFRLDGSTPTQQRKKIVLRFQESETPSIFLLSLKAGGQGLNLTKATYVFHLDPWWNPAVENQASDRAHRIGQKRTVSITRILMRHTIEEKMMFLKKKKLALYETVMSGAEKAGCGQAISKTDFDFLLGE